MKTLRLAALLASLAGVNLLFADSKPPALDPKRIINESYNFLKNQEPEMAADEYALYEKTVSLIAVRPDYGFKLLENLVAGGEHKSPAFELALGNVYYSNGKPGKAEEYYRTAIAHFPDFQRAWNNLAALLYSQGRYAEAVPCFTKVVTNGKADAGTLGILAYCQARTGNPLAAEMNYIQALGLDPDNADWVNGLLSLSLDSKQYGRAEMLLKQLIRLRPQEQHNWVLYASVLHNEGRSLEAIGVLDAAASLGFAVSDGLLMLGDLCTEQKMNREAIDAYRRVMATNPEIGAKRLIGYAQSLTAYEQLDEAEKALAQVQGELPADTRAAFLETRAELHIARKNWTAARTDLLEGLKLQPMDGLALLSLGRVYKAEENIGAAELALDQATRIPAVAHRAFLELGDLSIKHHRYERGIELLEKALAIEKSPVLQQYIAKLKLTVPPPEPGSRSRS